MTYEDFLVIVDEEAARNPQMRHAQVWFNMLYMHRPELAHALTGSGLKDPFYETVVPSQHNRYVETQW